MTGERLFCGTVASYDELLQKLAPLPHGVRMLLGTSEVLCDEELETEYDRSPARHAAVTVLVDVELQEKLRFCTDALGSYVPADWWSDRAFRLQVLKMRPELAGWGHMAFGTWDRLETRQLTGA